MNKYLLPVLIVAVLGVGWLVLQEEETFIGSVGVSDEYYSTTTGEVGGTGAVTVLKSSRGGALGSVTITGAAVGALFFYDATTTDVTLRANSTSSITIANIPTNTVAGTYVYDAFVTRGLIMETIGAQPTSTVLYR